MVVLPLLGKPIMPSRIISSIDGYTNMPVVYGGSGARERWRVDDGYILKRWQQVALNNFLRLILLMEVIM